jgi:hypothetical protein
MVTRVQHVDGEYRVVLTAEQVAALHLADGAPVQILPAPEAPVSEAQVSEAKVSEAKTTQPVIRYATNEEVLKAFRDTLPQHEQTYRDLAK